jgi:O-antigen ligase
MIASPVTRNPEIMAAAAAPARELLPGLGLWSRALHYVLIYGLAAVLAYGVLMFGAVEPWSLYGFEVLACALLIIWAVQTATTNAEFVMSPLFVPVLAFAAIVGAQLLLHRTAYAYMTRTTSLVYVAYAILLFVAVQTIRTEEDLKRFLGFLTVFGFLIAIFAVIQDLTSKNEIYWMVPVRSASFIFGPYVNHNHYAGIMEMLAPIPLVLSMMEELTPPKRVLLAFAGIFMAATIFLSLSRGGMTAFGCEVVFLAAILWWRNASRRAALIFATACLLILMFLLWLGGQRLVQRFVSLRTDDASYHMRLQIARDSVKMVKERPLMGWGLGTFPTVYPGFRTFYADVFINAAHNDYVQAVTETGLLGFAAVLGFLGILYVRAFRKLRGSGLDMTRAATLGALLGVTGILVHSLADFNLQIPANAALFYVVATIAAASFAATHRRRRFRHAAFDLGWGGLE